MGFLSGLFETKASQASLDKNVVGRAVAASRSTSFGGFGIGQVGNWDVQKAVTHGLEKVTYVFRAVDVISQNQASLPMGSRKVVNMTRQNGEWLDDPRIWKLLNMRANSYETAWQFRYRLSANLLLSRRGAFIEVVRGKDGRPSELHILSSQTVEVVPDPITFVKEYRVTRLDGGYDILPPDRVIWIKSKPHPTDPYAQLTPLMAAGVAVETDWLAHMFNRNFLMNDGRPGTLITISGQINPIDAEEIKSRFSGGPLRAGEASVIEADGVTVNDMSATPHDLQWASLLESSKQEILDSFGVPESVMGNASGRTFDNADAEREGFWTDTMMTHCDSIAMALDVITENDNDDILIAYDYDSVDVLQRRKRVRLATKMEEFSAGLATIDEYLVESGRDPWDVTGSRVLFHPRGMIVAANEQDQKVADKFKIVGEPPMDEGMGGPQGGGGQQHNNQNVQSLMARAMAMSNNVPIQVSNTRNEHRQATGRNDLAGKSAQQPSSDDEDPHPEFTSEEIATLQNSMAALVTTYTKEQGFQWTPTLVKALGIEVAEKKDTFSTLKAIAGEPQLYSHQLGRMIEPKALIAVMNDIYREKQGVSGDMSSYVPTKKVAGTNIPSEEMKAWVDSTGTFTDNSVALTANNGANNTTGAHTGQGANNDANIYTGQDANNTANVYTGGIPTKEALTRAHDRKSQLEGFLEGTLNSWDTRQAKVISERLEHAKFRKGTRHWEQKDVVPADVEYKAVDPAYAVDVETWVDDMKVATQRKIRRYMLQEANAAITELQRTGVLDQIRKDRGMISSRDGTKLSLLFGSKDVGQMQLTAIYDQVNNIIESVSRNQSDRVQTLIAKMDAEGKSMRQIKIAVRKMIGQRATWRRQLSANVVTAATEGARNLVYGQATKYAKKTWHSHKDERTRTSHIAANGNEVRVDQGFIVGNSILRFPGDPLAPMGETINCRCWLTYTLNTNGPKP